MERYEVEGRKDGGARVRVVHRGTRLLNHSMFNKSTAFTREERADFELRGLLPPAVTTLDQQARRAYQNIVRKADPLERYIGLAALEDRNEVLFYRVLLDHLEEFLPIVYTPTVGRACQEYSRIFRRARGLWISPEDRGRIFDVLGDAPFADVRLIVVTDNESILGIGDQGAGGMGIPIGKLALYTAAAGIHPSQTLPISLDAGTENQELLDDELYIGWRHRRLRGDEYLSLVDEFVEAVCRRFPGAVLQWEDFRKENALRLLERHRRRLASFNDDVQGTAAIALGAILAAGRLTGAPLAEQRVVILGAGAAGIGIARLLRDAFRAEGVPEAELHARLALLDSKGLLVSDRLASDDVRIGLAWPAALAEQHGLGRDLPRDLDAVVRRLRPSVLIGVSGAPGLFKEEIVREMARHAERPLVFPMSNPTSQSEAQPADLVAWTDGRALIATGSPFSPVPWGKGSIRVGQGNNVFVFPGVGLGALVSGAREISEGMFLAAARCLATTVSREDLVGGSLLPPIGEIRRVTAAVASAVVRAAREEGHGRSLRDEDVETEVAAAMWEPAYPTLEPA